MKTIFMLAAALLLNSIVIHAASPESVAIKEMAGILMNLDHYPTSSGKATLQNIAKDTQTSEQEKVVASALLNVEHKASNSDKIRLRQVIDDPATSAQLKEIAKIVYNLNHKPSSSDKETLSMILGK